MQVLGSQEDSTALPMQLTHSFQTLEAIKCNHEGGKGRINRPKRMEDASSGGLCFSETQIMQLQECVEA